MVDTCIVKLILVYDPSIICYVSTTVRTQRPHTGNSPKLLRRDVDLPPSTIDQDAPPYDNISGQYIAIHTIIPLHSRLN